MLALVPNEEHWEKSATDYKLKADFLCQFKNFMQKGCKSTKIKSKEDIVPEWCPLEKKKGQKST